MVTFPLLINYLRDDEIIYPSIGTSLNRKTNVEQDTDITDICDEIEGLEPADIINNHIVTRLQNDFSSNLQIKRLLAMKIFISKYEYSGRGFNETYI